MKKDQVATIRINGEIKRALESEGWTVQSLLDDAISKVVKVETKIKVKKGRR